MLQQDPGGDHNPVGQGDKNAAARPHTRPPDWRAVEDFLGLLARAVQQLRTYPAGSPLCVSAIGNCCRALAALDSRERLLLRVTPLELIVDDIGVGKGTQVGQELARRLHRAGVATVVLERGASPRELSRFIEDLVKSGEAAASAPPLLELLTEHGLERIAVTMGSRPEVLELGAPPATAAADLARERARFEAQLARGGVVNHLYPPQKGWIRLDPSASGGALSLLDLAILADDPSRLASMLARLTDDAEGAGSGDALEKKYSDVAMVISALEPRAARRLFGKLARAVLDLEPARRQALLRRTVLPGLLDGRIDGAILRDFPDVDLVDSLCLLLDLETAAPELLSTALARLDLAPERKATMLPLLDAKLREREGPDADGHDTTLARHARELVRVSGEGKSFADFSAFDLAVDPHTLEALDRIRIAVPAADITLDQLTCLWHLVRLEPNPEAVDRFLERSFVLLGALEGAGRAGELPSWLVRYRDLAARVRDTRPDVSDVVGARLGAFCTPARAAWIADLWMRDADGRQCASAVVEAVGTAAAGPLVALLEREGAERGGAAHRGRAAAQLLIEHATLLAPALVPLLEGSTSSLTRTLLRALGAAGAGYEASVGRHVAGTEEATAREALRALARIGTPAAAALVVDAIVVQRGPLGVAAEETLWHFPAAEAQRRTRELLGRRDFVTARPQSAERLLERVARAGAGEFAPALRDLVPLRFHVWKPGLARVGRKAHGMLRVAERT